MPKKIIFSLLLFSCISLPLVGMSRNDGYEQVQMSISMENHNDCNNCWGNKDCNENCQKLTVCLGTPFAACFCCILMACNGAN